MEEKKSKKQIVFMILGLIVLTIAVGGITYAFFTYRKSGDTNTVRAGSIKLSSNYTNVILEDVFPITRVEAATDTDNVMEVEVTVRGKTTYAKGVEYAVSLTNVQNEINSKVVPVGLIVDITGLGDEEEDYFNERGDDTAMYKVLAKDDIYNGEDILVGYIPGDGVEITGTITLKAFIDSENLAISDTYDGTGTGSNRTKSEWVNGRTVITSQEWKTIQTNGVSFKVKMEATEGTWFGNKELSSIIAKKFDDGETYVKSYAERISSNSTFATQDTIGTNNSKKTVYYYSDTSALNNGNVVFAGFCWQIIRTTDTGGTKLIYNGIAQNNQCKDDRSETTWKAVRGEASTADLSGTYLYGTGFSYDLTTGRFSLVNPEKSKKTWTIDNYESFLGKYTCKNETGTNCVNVWYVGQYSNETLGRVQTTKYSIVESTNYFQIGVTNFNSEITSMANVGYMYNKLYIWKNDVPETGSLYGTNVKYANGVYTVYDTNENNPLTATSASADHHYTCGEEASRTCEKVRYYYYEGYYIELANGEKVEDALKNMINYKQNNNENDANINVINSPLKDYVEIWYERNLDAYSKYIDTSVVYCNNRSVKTVTENNETTILLRGWDKDAGELNDSILFMSDYETANLDCPNLTDRFSTANASAPLKYPVGHLTDSERAMMGKNYLATGVWYWTMSPNSFRISSYVRYITTDGHSGNNVANKNWGVRPVITLRSDAVVLGGSGTKVKPYQVGPFVTRDTNGVVTSTSYN